jgi:hypothetical protein
MTLMAPQRPVTHRARKRARKYSHKERRRAPQPSVSHRSAADPVIPDIAEQRRVLLIRRKQRIALAMCHRNGVEPKLHYLSYGYWELRSCFGKEIAEDEFSYGWWMDLHYETREHLRKLSRLMRGMLKV